MRGLRLVSKRAEAERRLWRRLRNRALGGFKFDRQEPIGPHFADFVCREEKLVIEIAGATHATDNERRRDGTREQVLHDEGCRVARFGNGDVYRNIDGVLDAILAALKRRQRL